MAIPTNVLITGVARGIGNALAKSYLARPDHTVIGTVRDLGVSSVQVLKDTPAAAGSRLILVAFESTSVEGVAQAVAVIKEQGIAHLDIVIANAGICPPPASVDTVKLSALTDAFNVNTLGPIILYRALQPLLKESSSPRWVSMSSGAASLQRLDVHRASYIIAYGLSKAGMNWFTLAISSSEKWLTAFAIHPGLVQTDMGNAGAKMMGMEIAPNTQDESSSKTIAVIDSATRDATSGKFINVIDGTEIPW